MSSISAENAKHSHCSQHHCNTSAIMQQDMSHAEMSEQDKDYFTEDIASPEKIFRSLLLRQCLFRCSNILSES